MKALLKQLYDYQWELTLTGVQIEESILRSHCSAEVENEVRGIGRNLIIAASSIKYDLIMLEQKMAEDMEVPHADETKAILVKDALHIMEQTLFNEIKDYATLMASINDQPAHCEAATVLKNFWPNIAEIYQFFKTSLLKVEQGNYL